MTDLEITRLCAEVMNIHGRPVSDGVDECGMPLYWSPEGWEKHKCAIIFSGRELYNPLHDDAQAMALDQVIIESGLAIYITLREWTAFTRTGDKFFVFEEDMTKSEHRRRARCECVAKMQAKND